MSAGAEEEVKTGKARALDLLQTLADNDRQNVDDYNNTVSWQGYGIERHLHFVSHRLTHITATMVEVARLLCEEPK